MNILETKALLDAAAKDGVRVRLVDGKVKIEAAPAIAANWAQQLGPHRRWIVALLSAPSEWEGKILHWLDWIEETDVEIIEGIIASCKTEKESREYYLNRAEEIR